MDLVNYSLDEDYISLREFEGGLGKHLDPDYSKTKVKNIRALLKLALNDFSYSRTNGRYSLRNSDLILKLADMNGEEDTLTVKVPWFNDQSVIALERLAEREIVKIGGIFKAKLVTECDSFDGLLPTIYMHADKDGDKTEYRVMDKGFILHFMTDDYHGIIKPKVNLERGYD